MRGDTSPSPKPGTCLREPVIAWGKGLGETLALDYDNSTFHIQDLVGKTSKSQTLYSLFPVSLSSDLLVLSQDPVTDDQPADSGQVRMNMTFIHLIIKYLLPYVHIYAIYSTYSYLMCVCIN